MKIFGFLNIFKKKEKENLLEGGLNTNVVEGFLDKIEDIVCIANENYKIDYINTPKLADKYTSLYELLEYDTNKELYNEMLIKTRQEGCYTKDIEIIKNKELIHMYIAIYYIDSVRKYIVYIKDTDKYLKRETELKEKLSKSNEELRNKDLFVANLSHEIKTPINIIVAMTYFLKASKLDEEQNEYVNKLEESANLLTELVNNILNVTKNDKVTNAINTREKFNFKNFIDKIYFMFEEEIENKNLQWSIESDMDLNVELYEDKTKLEQIFINLISNAVKYTDKGYIELNVHRVKEDISSYDITFCIKDTGIGIKKEDSIRIFKEFEQMTDPTIKEREGFGLGLPLVKKIIESMGGKIWVESSYGLGTKFYFNLTLRKNTNSNNVSYKPVEDISETKSVEKEQINTNKVLLVDDNKTINEITAKILSEINLECDSVEDGLSAIKKVEEKGVSYYSLILMDIHMPKYNGYDISRILKQDIGLKSPIVALTATNITDKVIEENKDYISSYIQKPIKPEEFKKTIEKIVINKEETSNKNANKETILYIADIDKTRDVVESLSTNFQVITTLDTKDINIILETKKLACVIINNQNEEDYYNTKDNIVIFLNYNEEDGQKKNISIRNLDGYIKQIDKVEEIVLVIGQLLEKEEKESNIENTINEYNSEISDIYKFLYDSLVNLTSVRSKETGSHLMRTKEYMKVMLEEYEKKFKTGEFEDKNVIEDIGVAATLHDIGKVGIPDDILNKPGKLTDEEYEKIKEHVIIGHQILKNTYSDKISNSVLEYAKEITLHHHEKYNGLGYPDNLKGEEINIISRIMAIIDVYDALVNDRVYKKALSYEETEEYIISESDKSFDPKVVNVFMDVKEKLRKINETYKE